MMSVDWSRLRELHEGKLGIPSGKWAWIETNDLLALLDERDALRECVKAADAMRSLLNDEPHYGTVDDYDAARADLDGDKNGR